MAAVAEFSELWVTGDDSAAFEAGLQARMDAAYAAEPGLIAWLAHRDLKAADHLLIYKLFADEKAAAEHEATKLMIPPAPARVVATAEGPVAILVQCRVDDPASFDASMTAHVGRTLANEPGCLAFGWHRTDGTSAVRLYELYASKDALSAHRKSEHLAFFRGESEHLMLEARIHYAVLVLHTPLDRLLAYFGAAG